MNLGTNFAILRSRIARIAAVAFVALAVTGCDDLTGNQMLLGFASIESREELEGYVQRAFVRNEYTGAFSARNGTLSTAELYVTWDEFRALIVDSDSFLKYGVGLLLTRYPNTTYDQLRAARDPAFGPVEDLISLEEFDYSRLWGQTYLDQIKSRPENAYLVERERLFLERARRQPWTLLSGQDYRELLRDDESFAKFLTDDSYAVTILSKNLREPLEARKLGPIYTGVTPGTAS